MLATLPCSRLFLSSSDPGSMHGLPGDSGKCSSVLVMTVLWPTGQARGMSMHVEMDTLCQ